MNDQLYSTVAFTPVMPTELEAGWTTERSELGDQDKDLSFRELNPICPLSILLTLLKGLPDF
jgi:hypothetical protein